MRISDWSSDVCSSDLACRRTRRARATGADHGLHRSGERGALPGTVQAVSATRTSHGGAQLSVALDESWPGASEKFLADRDDALCAYGCDIVPSVAAQHDEIGRASWRARVCEYV